MNTAAKLLEAILRNPRQVRFEDACKAARLIGFVKHGGRGSHRAYARPGEPVLLNFQDRNGCIPPYQARQLIEMIRKYGDAAE